MGGYTLPAPIVDTRCGHLKSTINGTSAVIRIQHHGHVLYGTRGCLKSNVCLPHRSIPPVPSLTPCVPSLLLTQPWPAPC
jgi:hypothetical protein